MKRVVCFANREIGARIASDLVDCGEIQVVSIVTNDPPHNDLPFQPALEETPVIPWSRFVQAAATDSLDCFAGVSILFRHRVPASMLALFSRGVVNLHPSLLPFGRGSQPATWAIWQGEPYGASAHLMSEGFDAGPLLGQIEIEVNPWDTSFSLYQRGVDALWDLYITQVRPWIMGDETDLVPQSGEGTMHTMQELRELETYARDSVLSMEDHVRLMRALSRGPGGGIKVSQEGLEVDVQTNVHALLPPNEGIR